MSKHREIKKRQNLKSLKEMVYILVEGQEGNKSETTYFGIINRLQNNKTIRPLTKKRTIANEISGTKKENIRKIVVCDTDINETHNIQTFESELSSYVKDGYIVYISNKNWETWIASHFGNSLPEDYQKTESWYLTNQDMWSNTGVISTAIQSSNQVCDRLSLPHGISTSEDIQTFIREYQYCSNQSFTMIGFLLQSLIK